VIRSIAPDAHRVDEVWPEVCPPRISAQIAQRAVLVGPVEDQSLEVDVSLLEFRSLGIRQPMMYANCTAGWIAAKGPVRMQIDLLTLEKPVRAMFPPHRSPSRLGDSHTRGVS
jgi:hypothetical protein